jgi:hypothetical protein
VFSLVAERRPGHVVDFADDGQVLIVRCPAEVKVQPPASLPGAIGLEAASRRQLARG